MSLGPLCFLLGEMSPQVLYPFVNWIVCLRGVKSCEFSLCSGHHSLVPVITGKCVFPYSWSPFHFANGSFAMQKLVILMESHLSIVSFVTLGLRVRILVRRLLCGISEGFLPVFSSRTFME